MSECLLFVISEALWFSTSDQYRFFYIQVIYGTSSSSDRWKSCVRYLKSAYDMVLGRMFVEETFNNKSKIEVGISLCNNRLIIRLKLCVIEWPISGSYKGQGRIFLV